MIPCKMSKIIEAIEEEISRLKTDLRKWNKRQVEIGAEQEHQRIRKKLEEFKVVINENPYPEDVFVSLKSKAIRNLWKNWNKHISDKLNKHFAEWLKETGNEGKE